MTRINNRFFCCAGIEHVLRGERQSIPVVRLACVGKKESNFLLTPRSEDSIVWAE